MVFIEKGFPMQAIDEIAWSESNSRKPIYHMHKWFARRVGCTFRAIILASFLEEDPMNKYYEHVQLTNAAGNPPIILDPFMGGGTTIVEGHRLGCKMIGIDVNPMAWFITKKELENVDVESAVEEFKRIEGAVSEAILWFYKTRCNCGRETDSMYSFWVRKVQCQKCGEEVPLFKSFRLGKISTKESVYYCPLCNKIVSCYEGNTCDCGKDLSEGYSTNKEYTCLSCGSRGDLTTAWLSTGAPPEETIFAIEFYCEACGRGYKKPEESDLSRFEAAKNQFLDRRDQLFHAIIPDTKIPWHQMATMRPRCRAYDKYHQLFNERQLLSISMIMEEILEIDNLALKEFFLLTFSDALNANNMFCIYNTAARKLEPLFGGHYFSPPTTPIENNVWGGRLGRGTFRRYFLKGLRALKYQANPHEVRFTSQTNSHGSTRVRERVTITGDRIGAEFASTFDELQKQRDTFLRCSSSEDLDILPDSCVDAVVTDPPYYDNIMYSELSDFFYVWLQKAMADSLPDIFGKQTSSNQSEILVHSKAGKDDSFFVDSMTRVYQELHRVLKDDGLLTFVYQHKRPKAWTALLRILLASGFYVTAVYPTHGETPSGVRAHGLQSNTILVCRKRREKLPIMDADKLRERICSEVAMVLNDHPDVREGEATILAMGKALQVYTQSVDLEGMEGRNDSLEESIGMLESLVRDCVNDLSS
jgi:adenine-specific DNA methylase